MNWIIASLFMFVSSVALYLFVRKSNLLKTPRQLNNLAMFLVPLLVYVVLVAGTSINFMFKPLEYLMILVQAVLFSYLGNVFSLKGIEYSPNPGYSLIISKSSAIFTVIASVFIFSSPLTTKTVLAIILIMIFSALIIFDKDKVRVVSNKLWLPYAIGAFFCSGLLALTSKHLLNLGVPILSRLIISNLVVTLLILGEIKYKKVEWKKLTKNQLITLLLIGVFGSSFLYFMQVGFKLAPNVGYINATNAASISLVTIMSFLIFKDELTIKKIVGVFGVTLGLVLLFL